VRRRRLFDLLFPADAPWPIFSAVLMSFYILEETVIGMCHGKTAIESIPNIGGGSLQGLLAVGSIILWC
jgi:hypothetical protein